MAAGVSELPLRALLGTPDECLEAASRMAELAQRAGDLVLAETLLRGVVALDPRARGATAALAEVLLGRALLGAGVDASALEHAAAWARYALELDAGDRRAARVRERCSRLSGRG